MEVLDAIRQTRDDHLIAKVERSLSVIERAIDIYTYESFLTRFLCCNYYVVFPYC